MHLSEEGRSNHINDLRNRRSVEILATLKSRASLPKKYQLVKDIIARYRTLIRHAAQSLHLR